MIALQCQLPNRILILWDSGQSLPRNANGQIASWCWATVRNGCQLPTWVAILGNSNGNSQWSVVGNVNIQRILSNHAEDHLQKVIKRFLKILKDSLLYLSDMQTDRWTVAKCMFCQTIPFHCRAKPVPRVVNNESGWSIITAWADLPTHTHTLAPTPTHHDASQLVCRGD